MILVNRGYVIEETGTEYLLTKMMQYKKHCYRCKTTRPERSHHCSKCDRCIKKMDHHCTWLGTCINNDNLSHFIRFLFFASVSITMLIIYLIFTILSDWKKHGFGSSPLTIPITAKILTIIYAGVTNFFLITFFGAYIKHILKNITWIENEMCKNMIRCGRIPTKNPYDFGYWENFVEIMGKPRFLFLFGEMGDGLSFKKNYIIDCWPQSNRIEVQDDMRTGRVFDISISAL